MSGVASRTVSESLSYCWEILPHVSRTFALTIPVLREPLKDRVAVSYLLCRIADTIEDSTTLPEETRAALFSCLAALAATPEDAAERLRLQKLWIPHPDVHYQNLFARSDTVLDAYASFSDSVRNVIADCLEEMVTGMSRYPAPAGGSPPVAPCADLDELETYCHFVAGTVGGLLSRLFALELGPAWMTAERFEQGRRFGLGLQLTNVLKDHESDARRGIAYIPPRWMNPQTTPPSLTPEGLRALITRALEHLHQANRYVLSIPSSRTDLRLFCLWAAHLAQATLRVVAESGGKGRAKVDRGELWGILENARNAAGDDAALEELHRIYQQSVRGALGD